MHKARSCPVQRSRLSTARRTSRARPHRTRRATTRWATCCPAPMTSRCRCRGFARRCDRAFPSRLGRSRAWTSRSNLATLTETITVASSTNLLQTDLADVHTELKSGEIEALPLNRFRNYQALMNLVPGTTPMAFGNAETDTPARSLATNVNGQANTNNSTRTDGATNMNIWLPNHNMYISPAETIDTVNISTSSFDAEQGLAGGAAVTVITKSGTNQFKGLGVRVLQRRQAELEARLLRRRRHPAEAAAEGKHVRRHVGGPIARDRLFFFGSYEGYKREHSLFTFFSVPDATAARRRFQPGAQHQRVAPAHLQPVHRAGRHQPAAVREQSDPGEHDRSDCAEDPQALPDAQQSGHRGRRADEQLSSPGDAHRRPEELRRQNQFQSHLGAPDLGQVRHHGCRRRRLDQLSRPEDGRRR